MYNPNYINDIRYKELLKQRELINQQIEFEIEQQNEMNKMIKALNDYFDSAQKIAPKYQGQAITLSVMEICKRLNNKKM